MKIGKFWKVAGFAGTLAGSAALIAAASGATGAYFADTQTGAVHGNLGSIEVTTGTSGGTGGDHLYFHFTNMLPGTPQTITVSYKNTGKNNEDVYLVFTTAKALHAVNNLGGYGEATIKNDGHTLFSSTNLDDGLKATLNSVPSTSPHCSALRSGTFGPGGALCWPLPKSKQLASNLAPGASGTMAFSFAYSGKLSSGELAQAFCYPLVQGTNATNPATQVCTPTNPTYGLPYSIVGTQHGIAPTNPTNPNPPAP